MLSYGLPECLISHLQSAQNAAVRLIYRSRRSDHVTPLLLDLHWCVAQRIQFKLATFVYRCLNGTVPSYLVSELQRVADIGSRQRLRSGSTSALLVPSTHRVTLGDRSITVAAACTWNNLSAHVRSAPSLIMFRHRNCLLEALTDN